MRERINRLAKGIMDTEHAGLSVIPGEINERISAGSFAKGELYVTGEEYSSVKGLVYSTNQLVRVPDHSFGGVRNHIAYEVDARYLEPGACLNGSFYLVTNRGEKEISYSFSGEAGDSKQSLGSLVTAADFAAIARDDHRTALRLFDYQDFCQAPFMADIRVRGLYDGLKGRTNRANLLEEFLVALDAKKPVSLQMESDHREYPYSSGPVDDLITVVRDGWGYVCLEVSVDGDFIETIKQTYTDMDFRQNLCEINYRIDPKRLHRGRNYGSITVTSARKSVTISIVAEGRGIGEGEASELSHRRWGLSRYLALRLDYESGMYEETLLRNQMIREAESLKMEQGGVLPSLILAELYLLDGRREQACLLLDECRDPVLSSRMELPEIYCFYQYLSQLIQNKEGQTESLIRLIKKYLDEGGNSPFLLFLLQRIDQTVYDSPGSLLGRMRSAYEAGCCSPFLYVDACHLWRKDPGLLRSMDSFEVHALSLGAKKGMITGELADRIARLSAASRHYHRLGCELLIRLYEQYPSDLLLGAICGLMIRGDQRGAQAFSWYEKGLSAGISLTRLYEYYLYALPEDFGHLLPKEVLLYFSYDNDLDRHSKSVLYENILNYLSVDSSLYKAYERDIEKFAMSQLFESRIDSHLAVIYEHMIYEDMVDVPVAKVLPSVLRSYKIQCKNPQMKYVIVRYEEFMDEAAFLLQDGVAYVPLFTDHSILLFQDSFGNRYTNIHYIKTRVMEKPSLEERCFEVYPEHPMLRLWQCSQIAEQGIQSEDQALALERALEELNLHGLYRKKLLSMVVGSGYLIHMDQDELTQAERRKVCEGLIGENHIKEAYEMIRQYGITGIRDSRLLKLCTKMILQNLFDQNELLLTLSYQVFAAGKSDSVILDYLCEYYNGTTDQMYEILYQAIQEHVETYDLEERLLAQMLFSGVNEKMDQVFDYYVTRKRTGESIVKAYFTVKSMEYFVENKPAKSSMFTYLEKALKGTALKDKVPTVYLLALTKYYSELAGLTIEQRELCQSMVRILLEDDLVFPYLKKLADYATIPDHIMDKVMVQYSSSKDARIDFQVRVTPGEDAFHSEEMHRVYFGIFVKEKILFEGETMEYRILEQENGVFVLKEEGAVSCEQENFGNGESRFHCLNQMGLCLKMKDEAGLKKQMREYLMKNAVAKEVFDLL